MLSKMNALQQSRQEISRESRILMVSQQREHCCCGQKLVSKLMEKYHAIFSPFFLFGESTIQTVIEKGEGAFSAGIYDLCVSALGLQIHFLSIF